MELDELWDEMRLGELSEGIRELFPSASFSLKEMLGMLLEGRFLDLVQYLFYEGIGGLGGNGQVLKTLFVSMLLLGVIGAALTRFSELYEKYQVSELSFYLAYLLQAAILAGCFRSLLGVASLALERMVTFIKLLMPTYLFVVGMATGSVTASAGYQMTMLALYGVEELLKTLFLPAATSLFLLAVLEGIMGQERMEYLTELLKKVCFWGLKGMLGAVAGLSFLQAVLAPALDRVKASMLQKAVAAIPGIGQGAEGIFQLVLSSATVIKNSVGIVLTLLLLLFCLAPLFELFAFSFTLKLAAAIMGIVSDKRMTKAVDRTGDTGLLLLGITGSAMLFFLLVLAVATVSVR